MHRSQTFRNFDYKTCCYISEIQLDLKYDRYSSVRINSDTLDVSLYPLINNSHKGDNDLKPAAIFEFLYYNFFHASANKFLKCSIRNCVYH